MEHALATKRSTKHTHKNRIVNAFCCVAFCGLHGICCAHLELSSFARWIGSGVQKIGVRMSCYPNRDAARLGSRIFEAVCTDRPAARGKPRCRLSKHKTEWSDFAGPFLYLHFPTDMGTTLCGQDGHLRLEASIPRTGHLCLGSSVTRASHHVGFYGAKIGHGESKGGIHCCRVVFMGGHNFLNVAVPCAGRTGAHTFHDNSWLLDQSWSIHIFLIVDFFSIFRAPLRRVSLPPMIFWLLLRHEQLPV